MPEGKKNAGHPAVLHFKPLFEYRHLPEHLQRISEPFGQLAESIINEYPHNQETTAALRKLLEAKDCAVRAFVIAKAECKKGSE